MSKLSSFELAKCLGECREWHESALSQLTDAERVEYHRQVSFFEATKRWYRNVLDDEKEVEIETKRERKFALIVGVCLVVADAFFGNFDSAEVKLLVAVGIMLFLYFSLTDLLRRKSISRTIRMIERDASALGVPIAQLYKGVQREQEHERFWDTNSTDEEMTEQKGLESALLSYYFRMLILRNLVGPDSSAKIPSCFYGVL